jgi:hypothetical protein
MEEDVQKEQLIPICRPATRGDIWTYFECRPGGSRILRVENKIDAVYFRDKQIIEVHRPVTRTFSKWFGLRKKTESFLEIEEGFYFVPFGKDYEDGYFYFTFYEEKIKLLDLPDETRFIPTDKFVKISNGKRNKKKKKIWISRFLPSFYPEPELIPAS